MSQGAAFVFRVTSQNSGRPIADAETGLILSPANDDGRLELSRTDARGEAVLEFPVKGDHESVIPVVRAAGHREWFDMATQYLESESVIQIRPGERYVLDVQMVSAPTIEGTVCDDNDDPIRGADLALVRHTIARDKGFESCCRPHAWRIADGSSWPPRSLSAANGSFQWLTVPVVELPEPTDDYDWWLVAAHDSYATAMHCLGPEDRWSDANPQVVDLHMSDGHLLKGIVQGPMAEMSEDLMVCIVDAYEFDVENPKPRCVHYVKDARVDDDGSFALRGLADGRYTLSVKRGEEVLHERTVHIPVTEPVIVSVGG